LSIIALVAVILQGCLGGARVLLDARQLAMIHGCAGPAFFALCVAICVFTSQIWKNASGNNRDAAAPRLHRLAIAMSTMAFVQLVLGAQLRHIPTSASPGFFELTVYGHLIFAAVVTLLVCAVSWMVLRGSLKHNAFRFPALTLLALVVVQLSLGCVTWVVNYYWPSLTPDWDWISAYAIIESKGLVQTMIVTAHQATGSLVLGVSVLLTARAMRIVRGEPVTSRSPAKALKGSAA
jgi:cytochrome c oxidase assembly protein subunit 15